MLTVPLIGALVLGVLALLERANRRADAFDVAPGRTSAPGVERVRAEVAAITVPPTQAVGTCTSRAAESTSRAPRTVS